MSFTKLRGSFTGSLEPYVAKTLNYIFIEPKRLDQTIRGAFPVWEYDATDAFLWGIDLNAKIDFNNQFYFQTRASYIYAQDTLNKSPIICIPHLNSTQRLNYFSQNKK